MTAFAGRLFKLKIEYPVGSGTYIDFGGLTNCTVTIANEEVDITDKFSNGVKELLENAGVQSISVTGELYTKDVIPDALIQEYATENTTCLLKVVSDQGDSFNFSAQISNLERTGSFNDMEKYSISFASADGLIFNSDYWYAQFFSVDTTTSVVGFTGSGTLIGGPQDVLYPVYSNNYGDSFQTDNSAENWYKFDTDLVDYAGGLNASVDNGWAGYDGESVYITGNTSLYLPKIPWYAPAQTTIEMVVNITNTNQIGNIYTVELSGTVHGAIYLGVRISNSKYVFYILTKNTIGNLSEYYGTDNVKLGYHYMAIVWDSTLLKHKFYINGIKVAEHSQSSIPPAVNANSHNIFHAASTNARLCDFKRYLTAFSDNDIESRAKVLGLYGGPIATGDIKIWHDKVNGNLYSKIDSGSIKTEQTGVFDELKPVIYTTGSGTMDSSSVYAGPHPTASDWQPYES